MDFVLTVAAEVANRHAVGDRRRYINEVYARVASRPRPWDYGRQCSGRLRSGCDAPRLSPHCRCCCTVGPRRRGYGSARNPPPKILFLLILSLLVLAPLAAEAADGKITGVTAVPSWPPTGAAVIITVTGRDGPCGGLELDFGDGTPHETLSGTFPLSTQHSYTTTGLRPSQPTRSTNARDRRQRP